MPSVTPFPHVQPHRHLDCNFSHGIIDPAHISSSAGSSTGLPRYDHRKASFSSIARSHLQFPHPVQHSDGPDAVRFGAKHNGAAEHALRRKTPNGTLSAGYDGTPSDATIQPPATKHILVSSLETGHFITPKSGVVDRWQQPIAEQSSPSFSPAKPLLKFPPVFQKEPAHTYGASDDIMQDVNGASWVRPVNCQPGIDSLLYQTLPIQPVQRYYLQNGAYVPTVLPATLQSGLGPTASAGSGPYGPYWPDGAYIPYRPAAFRESKFTPSSPSDHRHSQTTSLFLGTGHCLLNQHPASAGSRSDVVLPSDEHSMATIERDVPLASNFPLPHLRQNSANFSQSQRALPRYPRQNRSHSVYSYQAPEREAPPWSLLPSGQEFQSVTTPVQRRVANVEFKERILSWAHSVYVGLLTSIHQSRRNSTSGATSADNSGRALKPAFYPKPPRQPGSVFASNHGHGNSYLSTQHEFNRKFFGGQGSHSYSNQLEEGRGTDFSLTDKLRSLGRFAAFPPAHRFSSLNESSTTANAVSALEILSHLCNESGWEWIDGMLLGGCLAYGLGDYHKAMRWYSRIIARDATHVEAISNLAATLHALDRREDALQHWLRAVKLRPSYFEAVEHLIGLLCSFHRGKEAVNVIDYVQNSLRLKTDGDCFVTDEMASETESDAESWASNTSDVGSVDKAAFDYNDNLEDTLSSRHGSTDGVSTGFGSSGYAIPAADNGRMLALVHAKGNMLYAMGDSARAATAFEDAILIAAGRRRHGIRGLIKQMFVAFSRGLGNGFSALDDCESREPVLLYPDKALQTSRLVFSACGTPPGLKFVAQGVPQKAAISTTSNALLSLAKIYQDWMTSVSSSGLSRSASGVRDILALYYLSLSLQPSPSTANNVGILLASIQNHATVNNLTQPGGVPQHPQIPGVATGSGVSLALAYYNYGLRLDSKHAHLYTNLGSLLKDIGQLQAAIKMYEQAVHCDGNFDIALANLANAVKDAGRINDAITYYKRAVKVNPDFAEAVCGLANALNSVCNWAGRGGIAHGYGFRERWHVDQEGMLHDGYGRDSSTGWIKRVIDIVNRQLKDGETWGHGLLTPSVIEQLSVQLVPALENIGFSSSRKGAVVSMLRSWAGQKWEGARVVRLLERATRSIMWQWYQDRYVHGKEYPPSKYRRPQLPSGLTPPNAPTVLPFHTFTCPLSAKQIRHISQRNGLRISCATMRSSWLPLTVYWPPSPPNPYLKVGYVSSDFNNHPLAHLMQSVFGLHNPEKVKAYCYATTASDKSVHRRQIEEEAPVFYDASGWSVDRLVQQIVDDGIHILVNLNGYTRGARNEVFAARPAPIHMSFMGFAGTLGAEWCDYILADQISIPSETLSPGRRQARIDDRLLDQDHCEELEGWVYGEKIVYTRDTFFCCDHRQSAPDSQDSFISWEQEVERRWRMRKDLFPDLSDDTIILGNFNQLYKIEPTTFRTWLRILARIPNAVLWLLRFPDIGEQNLRQTAVAWAGEATASRIIFTDVAPKNAHIARAKVLDLFLDTPECNAHTTATDVLWSGTPLLTYPRYTYKMCSRMASSILSSALPSTEPGQQAREDLIASSDEDYENKAIRLCVSLHYEPGGHGRGSGRLFDLRKMLFSERQKCKLFDTQRWVNVLEDAYDQVWKRWVNGEEGDVWL